MKIATLVAIAAVGMTCALGAQEAPADRATVRVTITHAGEGVAGAIVRLGGTAASTDAAGRAVLRSLAGGFTLTARRIGFRPDSVNLALRAGQDTTLTLELEETGEELEGVVVSATRSERRIADEAVRVEVISKEEIDEKVMMTPGDITMLLNETSGLRMQVTSPSLGGAGVRIQGLDPRYTLLLSDGLPLTGAQGGGLSLLQVPPVDLGRVEVIKGSASAMYGAQALGGVINLVSRRAGEEAARELLLNQTSRGGTDAVLFLASPLSAAWSQSLLVGAHRQERADVDGDGWADLARYGRIVARPRLFYEGDGGSSLFLTAGLTTEDRSGGTMPGRAAPDGMPYAEGLATRRWDAGLVARKPLREGRHLLGARAAFGSQRHEHDFGPDRERDRHRTLFAEATYTVVGARSTTLAGFALQQDGYRNRDVGGFDFDHSVPAAFAQVEAVVAPWLTLSAAARADMHATFGTRVNPRVSALLRAPEGGALGGWSLRASASAGVLAPSVLTDETEVVGLAVVDPPASLGFERAITSSVDVGGRLGVLELNATWFRSRVRDALQAEEAPPAAPGEPARVRLVQHDAPAKVQGTELVLRYMEEPWHVTASYAFIDATQWDGPSGTRIRTPLVPRHALGAVAMREWEETARIGLEVYYTGAQALEDNPYRDESPDYMIVGALVERAFGRARLFLNLENLTDVRQTRTDPLLLPARGRGGRWTTDAWTELAGRTVNGGVRWAF